MAQVQPAGYDNSARGVDLMPLDDGCRRLAIQRPETNLIKCPTTVLILQPS
jgi:hypothetical protein